MPVFVLSVVPSSRLDLPRKVIFDTSNIAKFEFDAWRKAYGPFSQVPSQIYFAFLDENPLDVWNPDHVMQLQQLVENALSVNHSLVTLIVKNVPKVVKVMNPILGEEVDFDASVVEPSEYFPKMAAHQLPSRIMETLSLMFILFSLASFIAETLPEHRLDTTYYAVNETSTCDCIEPNEDYTTEVWVRHEKEVESHTFFVIESICIAFFTIEYIMRLATARYNNLTYQFLTSGMSFIDLVSIIPYYISLPFKNSGASSLAILRVLRLARVSRVFKVARYSEGLRDMLYCLSQMGGVLILFFFVVGIVTICFGSILFYCEFHEPGSPFNSIPASCWYAVVTMTTVGYGDLTPISVWGRLMGGLCASIGVISVAIPAGIFITEFMRLHEEQQLTRKLKEDPMIIRKQLNESFKLLFNLWHQFNEIEMGAASMIVAYPYDELLMRRYLMSTAAQSRFHDYTHPVAKQVSWKAEI